MPDEDVIEAQADDESAEDLDSGTPPEPEEPEGTPPAGEEDEPPEDQNWKSLREKYPGLSDDEIRTKVAASYWDQTKALSAAAKERRELELRLARLEGRLEGSAPPDEPEPPPPEVAELDTYLSSLTEREQQVAESQTFLLKTLGEQKEKVGIIKGQIAAAKEANDEDKAQRLEVRLETAEAAVTSTRRELDGTVRESRNIKLERARTEKEKAWVTKLVKEGQARENEERQELEETLGEIPRIVDGHITEAITAAKIPADPALRTDLRETVRDKITIDLWKAGKDVPFNKIDVRGLVNQHVDRYMKAHGLAKRADFGQRSEARARVAGGIPPRAAPPTEPGKKPPVVSGVGALPPGMLRGRRILEKKGW